MKSFETRDSLFKKREASLKKNIFKRKKKKLPIVKKNASTFR